MRVEMLLAVQPALAAKARQRWQELGGSPSVILPGSDELQLSFRVQDQDSPEGRLLDQLARELEARVGGDAFLGLSAVYDAADVASAELLILGLGSVSRALDPATVDSDRSCPKCGLPQPSTLRGKPKLKGKAVAKLDVFTAEAIAFARENLAGELGGLRGAMLTEADSPPQAGKFFAVQPQSGLGYPTKYLWSEPCELCGLRQGRPVAGRVVLGALTFPRDAWDGSDFVGTSLPSNFLVVTQRVWKLVSQPRWRANEGPVTAHPIHLDPDAPPLR